MKNIFKILLAAIVMTGLWSCKKDEKRVILEGGTAPVLTSSVTSAIPLSNDTKDNTAFTLNWTNPEYKFNTGISSLDVNYNILIDTTDNFSNPDLKTVSVGTDLSKTFTQSEFNDILLNDLKLDTGMSHKLNIRVDAFLTGNAALLSSNTLSLNATPYAIPPKIQPPASGELFITGDATAGNWQCGCGEAPLLSQKFTRVSPTLFEITINLIGGKSYTFVPVYGSWNAKYSIATKNDPTEVNGGDFMVGGNDILAPATSGTYKITVDFQRGKFTVTPA
jgi:hypothetical protein